MKSNCGLESTGYFRPFQGPPWEGERWGLGSQQGPHHEGPCELNSGLGALSQEPQEVIKEFEKSHDEVSGFRNSRIRGRKPQLDYKD